MRADLTSDPLTDHKGALIMIVISNAKKRRACEKRPPPAKQNTGLVLCWLANYTVRVWGGGLIGVIGWLSGRIHVQFSICLINWQNWIVTKMINYWICLVVVCVPEHCLLMISHDEIQLGKCVLIIIVILKSLFICPVVWNYGGCLKT